MGNAQATPRTSTINAGALPSISAPEGNSESELRQVTMTRNNHERHQTVENDEPSHSDPTEAIQHTYERLISHNDDVKADLKKTFKEVRILVVGRAGSGKSTLIRMLLGEKGPRNIRHGSVGEQDISREWKHPNQPLIIHDSNGIDTKGDARMKDIKRFLGESDDMDVNQLAKRVHAVWYVFNALDNRVNDDHGLLKMLDGYGKKLPLLLIMTHHECAERGNGEEEVDKVMEEVLECISGEERRSRLKVDKRALTLVVDRTKELMDKELWMTWAACQAVNINLKVEASVSHILEKRRQQRLASIFVGFIPGVHQGQMALMFATFTHGLAKIWSASPNLEKAIVSTEGFEKERMSSVVSHLGVNMMAGFAIMAGGAMVALSSGIVPIAGVVAAVAGEGVVAAGVVEFFASLQGVLALKFASAGTSLVGALKSMVSEPAYTSKLLMSYGLLVLGAIMYAHVHVHVHDVSSSPVEQGSVEHYTRLFEEFLKSECSKDITAISDRYMSMWDAVLHRDQEEQRLVSDICRFFDKLQQQSKSNPN